MKEALDGNPDFPGGVWQLLHLKGTELVADGLTKPLLGQAFDRFLQDLGIEKPEPSEIPGTSATGPNGTQITAMMAMILGSTMISQAEAMKSENEENDHFEAIWVSGICLMLLGAIYVGQLVHRVSSCCLRRLFAASRRDDLVSAMGGLPESLSSTSGLEQTSSGGSQSSVVVDAVADALLANCDYDPSDEFSGPVQASSAAAGSSLGQASSAAVRSGPVQASSAAAGSSLEQASSAAVRSGPVQASSAAAGSSLEQASSAAVRSGPVQASSLAAGSSLEQLLRLLCVLALCRLPQPLCVQALSRLRQLCFPVLSRPMTLLRAGVRR